MRAHAEVTGGAVALTGPMFDGIPLRVAAVAGWLVIELLAITTWLDTNSLRTGTGLVYAIAESGPTVLRIAIAAAVMSLVFGSSTQRGPTDRSATHAPVPGISFRWIAAHFVAAGFVAGTSILLFQERLPPAFNSALAAAWLTAGAAALMAAAFVLLPPRSWVHVLRVRWATVIGALAAGVAASVLGRLALLLWQPMSRGALAVAFAMLHPFAPTATADPELFRLGTPEFSVLVSRECSGAEGLGLMLAFTVTWLWLHRNDWRFPRALLLVPVGLSMVWLFNCLRIAGLVLIGIAGAPEVALGGFHSQAGWLGFNAAAIGICLAARRVPWLTTAPVGRRAAASAAASNPTATYLMPFLALLAGGMISGLGTGTFEWFYAIRVATVFGVLWFSRQHYRTLDWRSGWGAIGLGVVAFAFWLALEPLIGHASPTDMPVALAQTAAGGRSVWLTLRVLGAVIAVPIAEELAFRGYLMRRFVGEDFDRVSRGSITILAIVVSSLAFGILHGDRWLAGTVAGLIYAGAYLRRGSIGDAIVAHATTNGLIAVAVLGAGQWQLW